MFNLNIGSGQRRFDNDYGWVNIDCVSRPPDQVPDVVCDASRLPYDDNTVDTVVWHHVIEHFGCGEADGIIKEAYRVLKPYGHMLIFVPNLRQLAHKWLNHEISDYIFMVNVYGAYQGEEGDRHKWGYSQEGLLKYLIELLPMAYVFPYNGREVKGADIAQDWWIAGAELIKNG